VVVDDGSTDSTLEILNNFSYSEKLRIISNRENRGIGYTANTGIKLARGRLVVRVDADDYVSEYFLQTLFLAIHGQDQFKAVTCDYGLVSEDGHNLQARKFSEFPIACGILFEKEALIAVGIYNDNLRVFEEEELMLRFSQKFRILNIPINLYRYRMHADNTSTTVKRNYKEL
jgi:glycosyltransferase involved in cell wall biosynthesis